MGGAADGATAHDGRSAHRRDGPWAARPGGRWALWPIAMGAAVAGAALQLQQAALWPPSAYVAGMLLALAAAAAVIVRGRSGGVPVLAAWALACATLAFGATGWRAGERLADVLPASLEGQDLQVVGLVARLPQTTLSGTRFVFEVESATHQGQPVRIPRKLSLGWYRGADPEAWLRGPEADLRAGQRWRLTVRLRQPHGNLNPQGFDLELWLFEQGIGASGYVRSRAGALADKLDDAAGVPVERLRQRVRDAIDSAVPDAAAAGVLAALAIGDQGAIDRADWDLFRATGVAHLMSISGLHVTMFAWLAAAVIARLWRHTGRAMLWCPAPVAARWGGLALAAGYAVLAGWGVPAQRTVLMLATVAVLKGAGLRWPWPMVLLAAAVVVTAFDPWALLQPGFWLSFAAVGLLMLSDPGPRQTADDAAPTTWARRAGSAVRGALHTQLVATVGLTPLTLVFFQQVSVVGFIANLVAIPLVTLVVTPLALLGIVAPPAWALGATVTAGLLSYLQVLAGWPLAVWTAAAAPAWASVAGLLGGALLVMPLPWRHRLLGVPLVLPLLAPPPQHPEPGRFEVVALDIGQGTAVLVRTATHLLVYDAGPQYSAESDAGQRVVLPLLLARGESHIDALVLSHRDSDHVGGAASLLRHARVRAVLSSLDETHPLRALGVPHRRCAAGQRWRWDGVDFEMLHPSPEADLRVARPNTLSCVLRISAAQGSVLLTGDIEAAQEAALLAQHGAALRTDVLLVPHHGSRSSSTPGFIDAVSPALAVVQAGYRSRFGHPAPDVVDRYTTRGIHVVRSDACGAWTQRPDGARSCQRRVDARYWHHGAGRSAAGTIGP